MRSTALSSRLVIVHSNPSCQQLQCSCTSVKLHCRYTVQQHSKEVTVYSTGLILQQHSSAVTEHQSNTHSSICNTVVQLQCITQDCFFSSTAVQLLCSKVTQLQCVTAAQQRSYSVAQQHSITQLQYITVHHIAQQRSSRQAVYKQQYSLN